MRFACGVCRDGHSSDALCLRHLRHLAGRLTWDDLRRHASNLTGAIEQADGRATLLVLWGSDGLGRLGPDDESCSICSARVRQFEWLADAIHRFPVQARGAAVAICESHAWWFAAFSQGAGRMLADAAAAEWTGRLRWLQAGLEHRPPDRLAGRMRALPATLAGLADDQGRLHIAVILRATAAAAIRSPDAALARLTAVAFGTQACPVCHAEDDMARLVAASGGAAVCSSHRGLAAGVGQLPAADRPGRDRA